MLTDKTRKDISERFDKTIKPVVTKVMDTLMGEIGEEQVTGLDTHLIFDYLSCQLLAMGAVAQYRSLNEGTPEYVLNQLSKKQKTMALKIAKTILKQEEKKGGL